MTNAPKEVKPQVRLLGIAIPKWIFFSILTIVLYGLMGVVAKFASNSISPLLVQVISTFGMFPLLMMLLFKGKTKNGLNGKLSFGIIFSVLVGVLSVIASVAQFVAYSKGGPASVVVPIISLASLVTVILARFVFHDKLNSYQLIGVILSIIAILLFSQSGGDAQVISGSWLENIMSSWMFFSLLGLFAAGIAQLFIKTATNHVSSDLVTIIVLATMLVLSLFFIFAQSFSWQMSSSDLIACLVVGVLGSAAFLTQSIAYSSGIVSVVAPLCSLFPVVTVIVSAIFLGEKLTPVLILAVIISSVAGITISMEKKPDELPVSEMN